MGADGAAQPTPLVYGENVLDWRLSNQELTHIDLTPGLELAWRSERPGDVPPSNPAFPHLCLFHTVLENAVPGSVIDRLQLAPGEAKTSPFLVAVTIE